MHIQFEHQSRSWSVDLSKPASLSIPLRNGLENPNCFWAPMPEFSPVRAGNFIGSIAEGGAVNFFNVRINPHGNGTHTECVGHIARERYVLHECLRESHFMAKIVSLYPQKSENGDRVIYRNQLAEVIEAGEVRALILRTLPNEPEKMRVNWSGSNPPYLHHEAVSYLVQCGVEHLLLDLPSVDREEDGGQLLGHRAFWQYPEAVRRNSTITEMIYVPNELKDGLYLLDLQTTMLDMDASPSKVLVYPLSAV